jgi:hypothetical protein
MRPVHLSFLSALGCCALAACGSAPSDHQTGATSEPLLGDGCGPFLNQAGFSANLSTAGFIDKRNEFFQSLGTNGRACVTCHTAKDGFSITPKTTQELFDRCELEAPLLASGLDFPALADERIACAIFRTNDGSNLPNADAPPMTRGVIQPAPPRRADSHRTRFRIRPHVVAIDDPYGYASPTELSLFRRPLPATDLVFDRSVMWDIRETSRTFIPAPFVVSKTLNDQLKTQANNATLRHAQAVASLTDAQLQSIVNFELGLFSAQVFDFGAGFLGSGGATGGVVNLSTEPVPANASNVFGLTAFMPIVHAVRRLGAAAGR